MKLMSLTVRAVDVKTAEEKVVSEKHTEKNTENKQASKTKADRPTAPSTELQHHREASGKKQTSKVFPNIEPFLTPDATSVLINTTQL